MADVLTNLITWFSSTNFNQFLTEQNLVFLVPEVILLLTLSFGIFQVIAPSLKGQQAVWRFAVLGTGLALVSAIVLTSELHLTPLIDSGEFQHYSVMYGMFKADLFSSLMRIFVIAGTFLLTLMSKTYLEKKSSIPGECYLLFVGATIGATLITGANDLIMAFVGLEALGISSFILSGYLRGNQKSSEASIKYLLYGGTATAVLLFGFSLLMGLGGGHTSFPQLASVLSAADLSLFNPAVPMMMIMILGGLAFKLSAAPFHMWTPDVYEGSPTPVTAFLSVVSKTAAISLLVRMLLTLFPGLIITQGIMDEAFSMVFILIAVLSMTFGNLAALKQKNIKRLLAYSTIAHVGYMLLGVVVFGIAGLSTMMFYLVAYIFMNLGAFAVVIHLTNELGREDIAAYGGLFTKRPVMAGCLTVFLLSLAGIPITSGFFAKFFLFQSVIAAGPEFMWLIIVGLLNSTISLYYYLSVVQQMVIQSPSDSVQRLSRRHNFFAVVPVTIALTICMLATVGLGIYAEPGLQIIGLSIQDLSVSDAMTAQTAQEQDIIAKGL